jgi:superfamily II helicase
MAVDDEAAAFGLGDGCPVHGDDYMSECKMCGMQFCRACNRNASICPDCADQDLDDDEDDADFEDVENLDALLEKDDEIDKMLEEIENEPPPEDLEDEED